MTSADGFRTEYKILIMCIEQSGEGFKKHLEQWSTFLNGQQHRNTNLQKNFGDPITVLPKDP